MHPKPIETVIFDLDGTLRRSVPAADDVQFEIANRLGANVPADLQFLGTRWAHYYWAQSPELMADLDQYGDTNGDFWAYYAFRYLVALTVPEERATRLAPQLIQTMEQEFKPENQLLPEVPETLKKLAAAGFKLGLISNRSRPCHEECEQLGLLHHFDFAYVAAEVGAWKPDPRIFERGLQISGSARDQTLYVGDSYYADIIGAHNAGLHAVLLDPVGLFPEADCMVIRSIAEVVGLVMKESNQR